MSSALVQKSLEIVDSEFKSSLRSKSKKKNKDALNLMPENYKVTKDIYRKGRKEKVNLLSTSKKLSVLDVRKKLRTKEEVLKENLKKIKQIREACKIELDKKITEQIIERAVNRRPVKLKPKQKKIQKTAFTEEDFKKFEEEYFG